ncbi:MAG: hypothetical protein PSV13_02220 [Lacunisphaera sp.]|nr:hypothetical protein [Lacunisphaera sp.]
MTTLVKRACARKPAPFRVFATWLVLGMCLGGVAPLGAADALPAVLTGGTAATPAAEKSELSVAVIEARRAALQKEITATRQELAKLPEGVSEDAARWLAEETALLERIDAVLAEQARTWQEAADLAVEAAAVAERTARRRPPSSRPTIWRCSTSFMRNGTVSNWRPRRWNGTWKMPGRRCGRRMLF